MDNPHQSEIDAVEQYGWLDDEHMAERLNDEVQAAMAAFVFCFFTGAAILVAAVLWMVLS